MLTQEDLQNIGIEVGGIIDQNINPQIDSLHNEIDSVKKDIDSVKKDLDSVKKDLGHVKNQMVTKDYLDEKLSDLKGDMIVLMRKGDKKLVNLVEILYQKAMLTAEERKILLGAEPFPQLL